MDNKNEKSKKRHSNRRKSPNDFAKTVAIFVCVELIVVVGAIIGVNMCHLKVKNLITAVMLRMSLLKKEVSKCRFSMALTVPA